MPTTRALIPRTNRIPTLKTMATRMSTQMTLVTGSYLGWIPVYDLSNQHMYHNRIRRLITQLCPTPICLHLNSKMASPNCTYEHLKRCLNPRLRLKTYSQQAPLLIRLLALAPPKSLTPLPLNITGPSTNLFDHEETPASPDTNETRNSMETDQEEASGSQSLAGVNDGMRAIADAPGSISDNQAANHVAVSASVTAARRRVSYEGWSQDVIEAHLYLTKISGAGSKGRNRRFGAEWVDCVAEWAELQGGTFSGGNLPAYASSRPQEIGSWLKGCRPWKEVLIEDEARFSASWFIWWSSILPVTRADINSSEADWRRLDRMGKCGIVLVMVSLVWWGECTRGNSSWLQAVKEVTQVLQKV